MSQKEAKSICVAASFDASLIAIVVVFGVFIFVKHIILAGRYKTFPLVLFYIFSLLFLAIDIPHVLFLRNPLDHQWAFLNLQALESFLLASVGLVQSLTYFELINHIKIISKCGPDLE